MKKPNLQFLEIAMPPGRITRIWEVRTRNITLLGHVRWWAAWRRYCYFPAANILLDVECLGEVVDFIQARMRDRREQLHAARLAAESNG